jgi:hypothetical protein
MSEKTFWIPFALGFACGGWTMRLLWLYFKRSYR